MRTDRTTPRAAAEAIARTAGSSASATIAARSAARAVRAARAARTARTATRARPGASALVKGAAAATAALLGAGAAAVAAGRYAGGAVLRSGRPLPAGPRLTVHAVTGDSITLTRDLVSARPGVYGLVDAQGRGGPGGRTVRAVVGPVVEDAAHSADTVVRRLERRPGGTLAPGAQVRLSPQVHGGDPRSALGIDHTDVRIPGEHGPLPAWFVPAARSTWVIAVHGLGTTREHALNVLGFLHRKQVPVLVPSHRGDLGAPPSPDGRGHLGETEWRDVDAALGYAVRQGAERVVLYGWSTGATMVLHTAARSPLRDRVAGLVLDSPVLDGEATLRALVAARRTPRPLLPFAVRAARGAGGPAAGLVPPVVAPDAVRVPTLLLHGPDDTVAPWEPSQRLADRLPDLVSFHTVRDAPHAALWNADPERYEETLGRFLVPLA